MEMAARELNHYDELVEKLKTLLPKLTNEELHVLESMTNAFLDSHPAAPQLKLLTEAQITRKIDAALEQIARGDYQNSEEMEAEIIAELGL